MWPGTANSGGWRSPQASAGTPKNTREPARSGKKKPQPRTVGVSLLVADGLKLPLEMGVLSFVQNVDKELRNGGKASTCGIHAGI